MDITFRTGETVTGLNPMRCVALCRLIEAGWKIKKHELPRNRMLLESPAGTIFLCRNDNGADFTHLVEIFLEKTYKSKPGMDTVIDVGVSTGESALFFLENGANRVVGVEPVPESFEIALENMKLNNKESEVEILNSALSAKDGFINLDIPLSKPNNSSVLKDNNREIDSQEITRIDVETVSLPTLINRYGISKIDLLKVDCEGCEYEVFRGLDSDVASKIEEVWMEYHQGFEPLIGEFRRLDFRYEIVSSSTPEVGIIHLFR